MIGDYRHLMGIVGHVSRQRSVSSLTRSVGADAAFIDSTGMGSGGNHLQVLKWSMREAERHPGIEWAVILEDDALPAAPFIREEVALALDNCPSVVASFYLGTGYPAQFQRKLSEATQSPHPWIVHHQLRHAVAYAVHVDVLGSLIGTVAPLVEQRWAADDAVTRWLARQDAHVAYSNPSLFDHDDELPSAITARTHFGRPTGDRRRPRRAMSLGVPARWNTRHVKV